MRIKKLLLTLAALACTSAVSMADSYTFVFNQASAGSELYGYPVLAWGANSTDQPQATKDQFVSEMSFSDAGINITAVKLDEGGYGFGMVDGSVATSTNTNNPKCRGLAMGGAYGTNLKLNPEVTVSVPGGTIQKITYVIYGSGLSGATAMLINGTSTVPQSSSGNINTYTWTGNQESVTFGYTTAATSLRYFHSIEVTYDPPKDDREPAGLSFSEEEVTAYIGDTFASPVLVNPHNLPLTWSSTNASVATVDQKGKVTLLKGGTTTISVVAEGTETVQPGRASYLLTVMPSANTFPQALAAAPAENNEVMIKFDSRVMYANGNNAYVIDPEGNAGQIHDTRNDGETGAATTIYSPGQIISGNWIATNEWGQTPLWKGLPEASDETFEPVYDEVTSITTADAYRVVILKNVTFTTGTASTDRVWGSTPNGDSYPFEDTFGVGNNPADTYDVKLVVMYRVRAGREYFWLAPIEFIDIVVPAPEFPKTLTITSDSNDITVEEDFSYEKEVYVMGTTDRPTYTLTFNNLPEPWVGAIGGRADIDIDYASARTVIDMTEYWPSVDVMEDEFKEYGMDVQKGTKFTFDADGKEHYAMFYLYTADGKCDTEHYILMYMNVDNVSAPDVPSILDITSDCESVEISQEMDEEDGMLIVTATGYSTDENVTFTLKAPAGYEGAIGYSLDYMLGKTVRTANSAEWPTVDIMRSVIEEQGLELMEGTEFTFPVDGEAHVAGFYLYMPNGKVNIDTPFLMIIGIEKHELFPATIEVVPDNSDIKVNIETTLDNVNGGMTIDVTGQSDEGQITLNFLLPEEYDGVVGGFVETDGMKYAVTPADEWPTVADFVANTDLKVVTVGTKIHIPANGYQYLGHYYLYADDRVDINHLITVNALIDGPTGINGIESADADAEYYDLQGRRVVNPEAGIYVKVANGKVSKVVVK